MQKVFVGELLKRSGIAVSICFLSIGGLAASDYWKEYLQKLNNDDSLKDISGGLDPCVAAANKSEELKILDEKILKQTELQAQEHVVTETALNTIPARLVELKKDRDVLEARAPKVAADIKYTSSFEIDPEKAAFLKDLDQEIVAFDGVLKMFTSESSVGLSDCGKFSERATRAKCETERNKMFAQVKDAFTKRSNMAKRLKLCIESVKVVSVCKPLDVRCPLIASEIMNTLKGAMTTTFSSQGISENILDNNADICVQAREMYLKRIKAYKAAKFGMGGPKTGAEIKAQMDLAKKKTQISNLESQLENAKLKTEAAGKTMDALQAERQNIIKEQSDAALKCSDDLCKPTITLVSEPDLKISPEQKMPIVQAKATPDKGAWSFHAAWAYNRVFCDYPPSLSKKTSGGTFLSAVYNDKVFGGNYKLTYEAACPKGKVSSFVEGKIVGVNPERESVRKEIESQLSALHREKDFVVLKQIACQESTMRQFRLGTEKCAGGKGMPYACNEKDMGIFQVSSVEPMEDLCRAAWDWKFNVSKGISIYGDKQIDAKKHERSELTTMYGNNKELVGCMSKSISNVLKLNKDLKGSLIESMSEVLANRIRDKQGISASDIALLRKSISEASLRILLTQVEAFKKIPPGLGEKQAGDNDADPAARLQREAIRRYNGGREYKYKSEENDCVGGWVSEPKTKVENKNYVNEVLGRNEDSCEKSHK